MKTLDGDFLKLGKIERKELFCKFVVLNQCAIEIRLFVASLVYFPEISNLTRVFLKLLKFDRKVIFGTLLMLF